MKNSSTSIGAAGGDSTMRVSESGGNPMAESQKSSSIIPDGSSEHQVTCKLSQGPPSSQNAPTLPPTAGPHLIHSRHSSYDSVDAKGSRPSSQNQSLTSSEAPMAVPPRKKVAPKKDRSKLRKGKWTVEEEEYTSRIIHYFSTGLLTLPEGATLRSYLADKLNCDPMRITKKYAGASCLGRRVYHFRDRVQPTIAEIQLAKAELDHLEQRFRMRVEEGRPGMPLPPHPSMLLSMQQSVPHMLAPTAASQAVFPAWLMGMAGSGAPGTAVLAGTQPAPAAVWPMAAGQAPRQWLLPTATTAQPTIPLALPLPSTTAPNMQATNDAMTNWAFTQAAASLAPAISQLAAANLQQQQTQQLYQQTNCQDQQAKRNALQLKETYEKYLLTLGNDCGKPVSQNISTALTDRRPVPWTQTQTPQVVAVQKPAPVVPVASADVAPVAQKPRTEEDQQAGTILLGFLSSLRQSYEDALVEKQKLSNCKHPLTEGKSEDTTSSYNDSEGSGDSASANDFYKRKRPAAVTDASSGTSTQDSDSNSDKKTDPSSSEDSDKEANTNYSEYQYSSKGPPRKRMKSKKQADERRVSN